MFLLLTRSTLFPYTTLFRSISGQVDGRRVQLGNAALLADSSIEAGSVGVRAQGDRKSTRLNSSHLGISYAVFCLKKKKKTNKLHSCNTHNVVDTIVLMAN